MTTTVLTDIPPHWNRWQWDELATLQDPDMLSHGVWMLVEEPQVVLGEHHSDGLAAMRMVNGEWNPAWKKRANSVGLITVAQAKARLHPDQADRFLAQAPRRPIHWTDDQWEQLNSDINTEMLFDAVWLMTVNPVVA